MLETRLPPYRIHQSEHERVLAEMSDRIAHWHQARHPDAARDWMDQGVGDWFVNHIGTMDAVTAEFIDRAQRRR
jgi:hemerythrin